MLLYEKKEGAFFVGRWNGQDFLPHLHYNYEILICTEGTLRATCGNRSETLTPGELMIAFSNDIHSYEKTEGGKGVLMILRPEFVPMAAEHLKKKRYENFLHSPGYSFAQLAESVLEEASGSRDPMILYGLFNLLMGRILRELPCVGDRKAVNADRFSQLLGYVTEHYTEPITLKDLSIRFSMDPASISRMFSTHFSMGFLKYLHELRVQHACHLLDRTDLPISEIIYRSGFQDQKSFNRVFLQRVGVPPREYRKQNGDLPGTRPLRQNSNAN